jgi:serine/threonine-protein kinase
VSDYDYTRDEYSRGDRGGGGRRWIPWVLGLVLVIAVVAGVAYYLLGSTGKTYAVPLVNNQPVAVAQREIAAQHLQSRVVDQASSTVAKGYVINSNPPEGNNVAANTVVTLYVSSGAAPVAVPGVVGQQESQAASALQNAGFKVATKSDPTSTAPSGQVISQDPAPPAKVAPGSTVTLTVSGGAVNVPSVVGQPQQTAIQNLNAAGFQVSVKQGTTSSQFANGTVYSQNPASGTAPKGSTVTIFVQTGASPSPSASASTSTSPTSSPTTPNPSGSGGTGGGGF